MAFKKLSIALAAVWLAAFAPGLTAGAQDGAGLAVEIASIDDSAFPTLSAVVNVLDAKGRPVAGLDTASFSASVDGKPATVSGLQTVVDSQVSLSVVLAVDSSGSMAGQPLTASQAAAAEFINGLSPQDSVAILAFSDAVTIAQEPTTDKATAIAALQRLAAVGDTALFEATSRAATKALESPSPRRVIILLGDGVDYGGKSSVTRDDSIAQARFAGVPIYTIALGAEVDKAYLSELAQATGARFLETPSPEGLSQLYADIAAVLRGQYIVALQSPEVDPATPHTLELSVGVGGVTVVASKGVGATASAQPAQVIVKGLGAGQEVRSSITITADVSNGAPTEVRFLVDGQPVATVTAPPYTATLDPDVMGNGDHTLRVEARGAAGVIASSETGFAVPPAATGGMNETPLLAGLLAVVAALSGVYVLRRRSPRMGRHVVQVRLRPWSNGSAVAGGLSLISDESPPPPMTEPVEQPGGKLIVVGGPGAGQEFVVGMKPISIGSAHWCDITVPDDEDCVGPEEARAWVHQDKLIFHKLMRLVLFANDEATGGWVILENGDEVTVGDVRLRFVSLAPVTSEEAVLNRAVIEAVQHFAARPSGGGASSQGFADRLWPVDDPPVEPSADAQTGAFPLQPVDDSPAEQPSEEEDVSSQRTPAALWPVDDLPIELPGDEEDVDPPATASSA